MNKDNKKSYRIRFWYWHQEVVISDITADELIQSLFFSESCDLDDYFYRETSLNGINGQYPISVTINDLEHLTIDHLKADDREYLDTRLGEHNGRTKLDQNYWILEEMK